MGELSIDTTLIVEKTTISETLKIEKQTRNKEIWYILSEPIFLPYDKELISKVEKGANLSVPYFSKVLQAFI